MTLLDKIVRKEHLDFEESYELFSQLMKETPVRIAAYLAALQTKGYEPQEIAGLAKAMRDNAVSLNIGEVADTAGTGGDGSSTINVSTATALILSNFIRVAKHGNIAVTSSSGSANFLETLGFNIKLNPEKVREMIEKTSFAFIFAPLYHPTLRNIMPVRKALKIRTVFNILGPLANPARPVYQLMGVHSPELVEKMAYALSFLGVKKALVVHGSGMDEVNPSGETLIGEVRGNKVEIYTISPEEFGMKPVKPIPCESPSESAARILAVLGGRGREEDRNFVLMNASAALYASSITRDFREGVELAQSVLGENMLHRVEEMACLSRN